MMLKTAIQERNRRLKQMAIDAIAQYNNEMRAGGEPIYPSWALNLLGLLKENEEMVAALAAARIHVFDSQDLETRAVRISIVQQAAS